MRQYYFLIVTVSILALPTCVGPAPADDQCVWAEGFETTGQDSQGSIDVEVAKSTDTELTLLAGDEERSIRMPPREHTLKPAEGESLALSNFSSGSSDELGPATGEARFVPSVRLERGGELVFQIASVQRLEAFSAFKDLDTCTQAFAVERLAAVFTHDDGELTLKPREGAFASLNGSRFWIELLDGFRASGESGIAYVVAADDE